MTESQARYLRRGAEVRVYDHLLGSVRAVVEGFDRASRRAMVRRFDLALGDFESQAMAVQPSDIIEKHRPI